MRIRLPPPCCFLRTLRFVSPLWLLSVGFAIAENDRQVAESPITGEDREHWSFQPLTRPAVPKVSDSAWIENEIDAFILAKLESREIAPQSPADRVTLIRRLYFDLIGLPPTPLEVAAFVEDGSADTYERLVDRLLASPHFGEHWAQHWLDLARFAETDGFEHDKVRKDAWKYRDWVIDALNSDLRYDRFVSLQLAGDELDNQSIATAFCLSGPDMPDMNSQEERRQIVLNEMTSTVGSVLLGLQVGCAQCHDHKYDPISQADFYRLRAVFEPAVAVKRDESLSVLGEQPGVVPASHLMIRGDWRRPGPEVFPDVPRIARIPSARFEPVRAEQTSGRRAALARWLTQPENPLTARVITNRIWQHHFGAGLSRTPSDFGIVGDEPSHPELLDWLATELIRRDWKMKQLHRLIVTSATYRQASRPASSQCRAAADEPHDDDMEGWTKAVERDPSNVGLSRFPRRRLSGEAIRDAMLAASGSLNTESGGPGVMPPLPAELVNTLLKGQWKVSPQQADHYRRSIYVFARRNLRYPIFDAFDRPDANASCARRSRSTTAPQSLLLLNSEFSLDAARRLAGAVLTEHEGLSNAAMSDAVRRAFCREPCQRELIALQCFVKEQTELLRSESRHSSDLALPLPCPDNIEPRKAAAFTDLCLALFNANEFLYLD